MRIAISNTYVWNKQLPKYKTRLRNTKAAILALSESQRVGKIAGYIRHSAPPEMDAKTREVAIYTRKNIRVDSVEWIVATKDVGGNAHARTIVEARVRHGGTKFSVINVHNNPGRKGASDVQAQKLMREVLQVCLDAIRDGYLPVVVGDFNRRSNEKGVSTPSWLRQKLDGVMGLYNIDGYVTTKDAKVKRFVKRNRPPGSDHPLLVLNVVRKKK